MLEGTSSWSLLSLVSTIFVSYLFGLIAYRLFLHPLRGFPGDTLAAVTKWHWHYHASDSEYLDRQHLRYGPVVRIGPNELHFNRVDVYFEIYHMGNKFTKDPHFYASFGEDESSFGFRDPREAKRRREILSPLFSRRAILRLESIVQEKVDILLNQVLTYEDRAVDLFHAFRSATLDIISGYCFAQSFSALTYPSFRHPVLVGMDGSPRLLWIFQAFPFIMSLLISIPPSLLVILDPSMKGWMFVRSKLEEQIEQLLADPGSLDRADHEIIYHHLLTARPIPSKKSLLEEALALTFAGSETVANASSVATFHVLNNKKICAAVVKELDEAWPEKDSPMTYETLEKLPYLTAVLKESLRVSHGVVSPLPRVVGPDSAVIGGWHVPAGTTVSIASTFLHNNTELFPNPHEFNPDRWLQANSRELENYLVPFSRGPRSCLGINLAWCELYLILGNIFRKLDMEAYNTSLDDFKYRAYFLPSFIGRHLHVTVKARES